MPSIRCAATPNFRSRTLCQNRSVLYLREEAPFEEDYLQMTATDVDASTLFLEFSRRKLLEQYWPRLRGCVESLTDEQIWWRANPACNSIGNLILHLNGNVGQWLVASFNRQQDGRNRAAEFHEAERLSGAALLAKIGATMQEASIVLGRVSEPDLLAPYEIQGYHVTGLYAVYQVVEHFGMHYGQILSITKQLTGEGLDFYKEFEKTGRLS